MSAELATLVAGAPLLLAAAFVAGALNALAGGGSFLTLPALVACGVPPVVANATGTVALLPGYATAAAGMRRELAALPPAGLQGDMVLVVAGGSAGAALLLLTPAARFAQLLPWLLLVATLLFALAPRLTAGQRALPPAAARGGLFLVAVYGGYFNGGMGILLLALAGLAGERRFAAMNARKNLHSFLLTAIAVCLYAAGGLVHWPAALLMAVAAMAGGLAGARLSLRLPGRWLRAFTVATGAGMTLLFFLHPAG